MLVRFLLLLNVGDGGWIKDYIRELSRLFWGVSTYDECSNTDLRKFEWNLVIYPGVNGTFFSDWVGYLCMYLIPLNSCIYFFLFASLLWTTPTISLVHINLSEYFSQYLITWSSQVNIFPKKIHKKYITFISFLHLNSTTFIKLFSFLAAILWLYLLNVDYLFIVVIDMVMMVIVVVLLLLVWFTISCWGFWGCAVWVDGFMRVWRKYTHFFMEFRDGWECIYVYVDVLYYNV